MGFLNLFPENETEFGYIMCYGYNNVSNRRDVEAMLEDITKIAEKGFRYEFAPDTVDIELTVANVYGSSEKTIYFKRPNKGDKPPLDIEQASDALKEFLKTLKPLSKEELNAQIEELKKQKAEEQEKARVAKEEALAAKNQLLNKELDTKFAQKLNRDGVQYRDDGYGGYTRT